MARSKVTLKLDWRAIDQMCAPAIERKTAEIAGRANAIAGRGSYGSNVQFGFPGSRGRPRTHGLVFTQDFDAMLDNAKQNTILKAAQSG
jgi:hypothetical protein